jgi:hypothetical protein
MDQLGNLLDRPRLYYNIDGLGELGVGVMFLGTALLLSLPRTPFGTNFPLLSCSAWRWQFPTGLKQ